jgi:hypothetical protein
MEVWVDIAMELLGQFDANHIDRLFLGFKVPISALARTGTFAQHVEGHNATSSSRAALQR